VLISGSGTNLQALIDDPGIEVVAVVSSRGDAGGLERAARSGIPSLVTADEDGTAAFLEERRVQIVVLAGYMRILSREFVARFGGRMLNVHPSLLPAFPGANAVRDALEYGVRYTGVTVHLVTEDLHTADTGPIVLQEVLPVSYDETPEAVTERLHEIEHRLLPRAVKLLAAGRLAVEGRRVRVRERA
jgi:phosphoribosylglycinamide formyltransferase 1